MARFLAFPPGGLQILGVCREGEAPAEPGTGKSACYAKRGSAGASPSQKLSSSPAFPGNVFPSSIFSLKMVPHWLATRRDCNLFLKNPPSPRYLSCHAQTAIVDSWSY